MESWLERLPAALAEEVLRYRQVEDRWRVAGGKLLLAHVLQRYSTGFHLSDMQVTAKGRPCFVGAAFDFNISHSGDLVALAWCASGRIGMDVERHRPVDPALFRRNFTGGEWAQITASADPTGRFFHFWAIKESLIKADGRGVEVLGRTEVRTEVTALCDGLEYNYRSLFLAEGYSAAVAADFSLATVNVMRVRATGLYSL